MPIFSTFARRFLENFDYPRILFILFGHTIVMIKTKGSISDVKQMIHAYAQQRVALKVNLGRNRTQVFSGVLSGVYPMLFTVQPDDKNFLGKRTFSYGDVLCGTVKIKRLP